MAVMRATVLLMRGAMVEVGARARTMVMAAVRAAALATMAVRVVAAVTEEARAKAWRLL
jgi:hypothetical protein